MYSGHTLKACAQGMRSGHALGCIFLTLSSLATGLIAGSCSVIINKLNVIPKRVAHPNKIWWICKGDNDKKLITFLTIYKRFSHIDPPNVIRVRNSLVCATRLGITLSILSCSKYRDHKASSGANSI